MEHSWANLVRSVLTLTRIGSVFPFSRSGERVVADADTLERPEVQTDEPSVGAYLELLNKDIARGLLGRFQQAAIERWQSLVSHVKFDRENDRIEGDVGL